MPSIKDATSVPKQRAPCIGARRRCKMDFERFLRLKRAIPMSLCRKILLVFLFSILAVFMPRIGHAQQAGGPGFPDAPGKEVVLKLCLQCHNYAMWSDHRQDRRGWEGVLYRMVGKGALWQEDEIKSMADYLGAAYGPPPAKASK